MSFRQGARQFFNTKSGNAEEQMYKELFEQFVANTLPQGYELVIPGHTFRQNCFNALNVDTLTFSELESNDLYGNNSITGLASDYGSTTATNAAHMRVLKFPAFTYWGYYYKPILAALYGLEHIYIPSVTSFQASQYGFHGFKGDLLRVHIDKTAIEVKAFSNFPGFGTSSLALDKVVFVCTDGTLAWDGSDWSVTQSA